MSLHGDIRGARRWIAHTPVDAVFTPTQLAGEPYARGIYIETTGPVSFYDPQGNVVTLPGLLGGVIHPIQNTGIRDTGTTATTVYVCF